MLKERESGFWLKVPTGSFPTSIPTTSMYMPPSVAVSERVVDLHGTCPSPFPLPPDPPLDPSGPSAGRVVVSGDRRFSDCTMVSITKEAALCLLGRERMAEAKAAAASEDGTMPKYLVMVYARRAGEDGPPVSFKTVAMKPSRGGSGGLSWSLSGLGPLRRHLGLACRAPVRLVREVGQDCRVRLVVEPREEEAEGGAGGKGKVPAAERVEAGDAEGVGGGGGGGGGTSPEGAEPGSSTDGEEGSTNTGGGGGSGDYAWAPGAGDRQGAWGAKGPQPSPTQSQPLQRQPPQPLQEASRPVPQPQQQQEPHLQSAHQHQPQAPPQRRSKTWHIPRAQPQPQQPPQRPQAGPGGGPSVGSGEGVVGKGPGGGEEGRRGEQRRLEVPMEQPQGRPAASQDGRQMHPLACSCC